MARYFEMKLSDVSLIGRGGKSKEYIHYCPVADVKFLTKEIVNFANKNNGVTIAEIFSWLEGKNISKTKVFTANGHEYKIAMIFQFLLEESILLKTNDSRRNINFQPNRGKKSIVFQLAKDYADFAIYKRIMNV